jgi:hypothetical protein
MFRSKGLLRLTEFFLELCLLRRAPQDLPASSALLGVTLAADLLAGMLFGMLAGLSPGLGLAQGLTGIVLMLALLYGALYLVEHTSRFLQSATALLGTSALLELIASLPLGLLPPAEDGKASGGVALLLLALVAWSVMITGHILRHTFDLRLVQGVGIAVIYSIFSDTLLSGIFSGA